MRAAHPELTVRATADEAAAAAADEIAAAVRRALRDWRRCCVAFSGGRGPERMFEELAKAELEWRDVHVFQVDERLAPDGHIERNLQGLSDHLLAHVGLPAGNLHPMPVGMASLVDAARRYEAVLEGTCTPPGVLDVVHLGLGADGHTASLFARDETLEVVDVDVAAVGERAGWRRLTLTLPALDRARRRVWLVTGADKAGALRAMIEGEEVPAARVRAEESSVFADESAAAALHG